MTSLVLVEVKMMWTEVTAAVVTGATD
jgi:hypothetical protein